MGHPEHWGQRTGDKQQSRAAAGGLVEIQGRLRRAGRALRGRVRRGLQPSALPRARLPDCQAPGAGVNPLFEQLAAWPHILQSQAWAEFKARWGWKIVTTPYP